jgi:UDP-2,3-diacylglucosamine pyrophosphatase LpxH
VWKGASSGLNSGNGDGNGYGYDRKTCMNQGDRQLVGYYAPVKRLVIADAHVGQRGGDASEMARLVRTLPESGFAELIYLGDAFQYLIGMSKFWTGAVREVMAAWDVARSGGLRIGLIEGNRDFFLEEKDLLERVDWTGRIFEFDAGPRRYRLDHGDRVNLRDLQYQFWSRFSKSALARAWARLLPRSVAVGIVRAMEARLAKTNQRFRYHTPERALHRSAGRAWADGVDVLLWGHFHRWWQYSDGQRQALVVPAWLDTTQSLAVDADGEWSFVDACLAPCDPPRPP